MEAREAYRKKQVSFEYVDVLKDSEAMARMLQFSKGQRLVPVIVCLGEVQIGFAGGS
jgi:glutaredoxin